MTNEAILNVLNNLCNEARNAAHATFGLMELHRNDAADSPWRASLEIGRSSADRLLQCMDDLRELLSGEPAALDVVEEFDLASALSETVELLNLVAGERAVRIRMKASSQSLMVRQDRQSVEQALTRILDAASKIAETGELYVATNPDAAGDGVLFTITPPDSGTAACLAEWLNADPEEVGFQSAAEASFGVAAMVAGKRLRALGGTAELVRISGEPTHLAIHLHSQPAGSSLEGCPAGRRNMRPDALNILLTEDSEDSYALTALLLRNESVWRARNGLEAVEIVKQRRFDVVFMDIHMPGMDGYTTIRAIREWETLAGNARTPIVVLSSDDVETQRRSAARAGCSGFLRKPIRNAELLELVDRLKATRSLVA
jgi:CheY-like chemotaxis protein